jgi:hypothetical protein
MRQPPLDQPVLPDEALANPIRLWNAARLWLWFRVCIDPPVKVKLHRMLFNYRRPHDAHRKGWY